MTRKGIRLFSVSARAGDRTHPAPQVEAAILQNGGQLVTTTELPMTTLTNFGEVD